MRNNIKEELKIINTNISKMFNVREYDDHDTSYEQLLTIPKKRNKSGDFNYCFISTERSIVTFVYAIKIASRQLIKLPKAEMRQYIVRYKEDVKLYIKENNANNMIFSMMVIVGNVDNKTLNRINKISVSLAAENEITIEVFMKSFFSLHQLDHVLTPPHKIFRKVEDVDNFLSQYMLSTRQLPEIYETDIISRLFYARVGDYFEIIRQCSTTGSGLMIRKVTIDPRIYIK